MQKKAFTLVETIVVITILGLLATIGFVSYSGYLKSSRDTNRVSQLNIIQDALNIYATKGQLPLPDNKISIYASGSLIAYQGFAGENVLNSIQIKKGGTDPNTGEYFSYYISENRKNFQLLGYIEEQEILTAIPQTHAFTDKSNKYILTVGDKLGILTLTGSQVPIHTDSTILSNGNIDIVHTNNTYQANITSTQSIVGTGSSLKVLGGIIAAGGNLAKNCKQLLDINPALLGRDGIYSVELSSGNIQEVYCDMTTDNGGWTISTILGMVGKNIFKTGNSNIVLDISTLSTNGSISNIWRDDLDKDILIQCSTNQTGTEKKYEIPFIIYNNKKADIGHLEKDNKGGTIFSSSNLSAKWNGYNYTLNTMYGGDGVSFLLQTNTSPVKIVIDMENWDGFLGNPNGYNDSPAFGLGNAEFGDSNNYCWTAIR